MGVTDIIGNLFKAPSVVEGVSNTTGAGIGVLGAPSDIDEAAKSIPAESNNDL